MKSYMLSGYADFYVANHSGQKFSYAIQVKDGVNYEESFRVYSSSTYIGVLNPHTGVVTRSPRSKFDPLSLEVLVISWLCNVIWRDLKPPKGYDVKAVDGTRIT